MSIILIIQSGPPFSPSASSELGERFVTARRVVGLGGGEIKFVGRALKAVEGSGARHRYFERLLTHSQTLRCLFGMVFVHFSLPRSMDHPTNEDYFDHGYPPSLSVES